MRVLVTRPQPDADRTAALLIELGHEPVLAPLLVPETILPGGIDLSGIAALAITSGRVPDLLVAHPQAAEFLRLPVFAVGDRSALAAGDAGFSEVASAGGAVEDLAARIGQKPPAGTVLYLAAETRAGDLESLLSDQGIACKTLAAYRMEPVRTLPAAILDDLKNGRIDSIPVYSRRSAETLKAALETNDLWPLSRTVRVAAISALAAGPLSAHISVEIATRPTEADLLERALTRP